ncbi:MAG: tRNA pseudouridine(55) synthase TruB [Fimbriimonadales bacterium]
MDGVINLIKPSGITSHDLVDRLRAIARQKEVGHAGTLDPMADGVMLCLLGRATRLTPYLHTLHKYYQGTMTLGMRTTTQDAEGEVFHATDASHITLEQVQTVAKQFIGTIQQIPPMYSAVKIGGQKLHELARQGVEVERKPRPVTIYALEILNFHPGEHPRVEFRVECGSGTYIRTLASDIGDQLGVGAYLSQLTRTAIGVFRLEDAHTLDELNDSEHLQSLLMKPADALYFMPRWKPTPAVLERLLHGNYVQAEHPLWTPGNHVLVMEDETTVALIARWLPPLLRPVRVIRA